MRRKEHEKLEREENEEKKEEKRYDDDDDDISSGVRLNEAQADGVGVGGTVNSESALRSAGTILSRVRAPPPAT
ncbi:hypothetical protein PoB_006512300 [Plakobranchus ocellatus]|uniref:Uncharacterized protein n=1 Tax=Plakobranchus ocellatus TaxID=259542 RepID=A0AAV4D3K3_9GAST|nr:hypothetical protein PoB_006512300 [Plakobranchus ocellatus]